MCENLLGRRLCKKNVATLFKNFKRTTNICQEFPLLGVKYVHVKP